MNSSPTKKPITWKLREAFESDRDGILALRGIVFPTEDPEKRDPVFWNWEFLQSPAGRARLFVAEEGETIVGHYAIIPQRFVLAGKPTIGSIVVDVMTHPDYRFQGMFKKIGRFSLEAAADSVAFATGYPIRKEVMPGHLSIGWVDHLKIPVLVRPLHLGSLARRFRLPGGNLLEACVAPLRKLARKLRTSNGANLTMRLLGESDLEDLAAVGSAAFQGVANFQVRDREFFQYRYFSSPMWKYRICGVFRGEDLLAYSVVRDAVLLDTPSLAYVDLGCLPGEDAALLVLLRNELDEGHDRGLATAGALVTRGHRYYCALRKLGLFPGPHRFTLILYCVQPDVGTLLLDPSNTWFLTWGDTDDV